MKRKADRRRFAIDEIRHYLRGCILLNGAGKELGKENHALQLALSLLGDKEDGIEAVLIRRGLRGKCLTSFFACDTVAKNREGSAVCHPTAQSGRRRI